MKEISFFIFLLSKLRHKKNTCLTLKINSKEVFDNVEERMMTMYVFENHITGVYNNIRQKFVDLLMKV